MTYRTKSKDLKRDLKELAYWKAEFKKAGNKVMWHECCRVEKFAKFNKPEDAEIVVKHALDVLHGRFSKYESTK